MITAIAAASPTPIRLKMSVEYSLVLILSINSEIPPTIKITASHTVQRKQTLLFLLFSAFSAAGSSPKTGSFQNDFNDIF